MHSKAFPYGFPACPAGAPYVPQAPTPGRERFRRSGGKCAGADNGAADKHYYHPRGDIVMTKTKKDAAAATAGKAQQEKAPVEKKAPAAKAAPAECAVKVFVQYNGKEYDTAALVEQVKAAYAAEGHRVSAIKELNLYVKPEDGKAYYAVNQKNTGSVDLA